MTQNDHGPTCFPPSQEILAKCLEATEALGVVALGPLGWAASVVHLLQLFKSQNH